MSGKGNEDVARCYKRRQIESATPAQLVVLLYEGAIDHLNRAELVYGEEGPERIEKFHNHLIACQNIVTELTVSLDMDRGGDIAANLFRLYDFMNHQLIEANLKKELEPIHEVKKLLTTLRAAWVDVADKESTNKPIQQSTVGLNLQG